MQLHRQHSASRAGSGMIERLEGRRLLSADLVPSFAAAIPSALVTGEKTKAAVDISLTNSGDAAYKGGGANVTIFAASSQAVGADEVPIVAVPIHGTFAVGQTRDVAVGLKAIPASLFAGSYYFDARVTQSGLPANDVFSSTPVTVSTPSVDLTPHITGIVKLGNHGHYIVVQIIVNNEGTSLAKGSLRIGVEFSYYSSGAGALLFRTVAAPIHIAGGASKTVRIAGNVPKSFTAFDYHMVAVLNANKGIAETDYGNDTVVTASYFYLP